MVSRVDGAFAGAVLDEFAEAGILAVAHRPVETDRMAADIKNPLDLFDRQAADIGDFLGRPFTAQLLQEPLLNVPQLAEHVDHVDRNADRPGLISNGPRNRLANPPRCVRAEFETAAI